MYITRECEEMMKRLTGLRPVLSVMGPRQAGKTKMIRHYFPNLPYYDLEKEDVRAEILKVGPAKFVRQNAGGAIFDEIHLIPEIISEIKALVDELIWDVHQNDQGSVPTRFVVTGSHNYLLDKNVKETLVGRTHIIDLASMTASELNKDDPYELMYKGGYPILHINGEIPETFFPSYIRTYMEREVRDIHKVKDLSKFQDFMKICANRVGNVLDYDGIASRLAIKARVIEEWLSLLQVSYLIFTSRPYYKNFEMRLSHRPKLYFYDTGLASYLLGSRSIEGLKTTDIRGKLFENLVMSDLRKKLNAQNRFTDSTYFWNITGNNGYEIDIILESDFIVKAIEVKMSDQFNPNWFSNLNKFGELTKIEKYVIYTGPTMDVEGGKAIHFKDIGLLL